MLDKKDLEILDVLRTHAKWTTHHISKKTLIPITTVHNRIKKMEKMGIIKGYSAVLDYKKLGMSLSAFLLIDVGGRNQGKKSLEILRQLENLKEVHEAYFITGEHDIVMRISVEDTESLNSFLMRVDDIDGVQKVETFVVLKGEENHTEV